MADEQQTIERGTYEILRDRLIAHGKLLSEKANALNQQRLNVFGSSEMTVLATERIRTENNCSPRDIVEIGDKLLFGYNVFIGLKTETAISDVFSLHRFVRHEKGFEFQTVSAEEAAPFLADPKFVRDFKELYQYYRDAKLLQLRRVESKILAVFQTADRLTDIKVFRWAIGVDGTVTYIDNRGERDHVFPASHDFEWTRTTREDHVRGKHPHVSILDEVFVETIGGNVTIKIEDNTESGRGIYEEPVDDPDQSLDDGEVWYAKAGSIILLKLLPYREKTYRYYIFNTRTKSVARADAIGQSCLQLPEDHGIIFPGGYYLRSGELKVFDATIQGMEFLRMVRSPNGEDVLYVFHKRDEGKTLLLPYNLIRKEVVNPLTGHGYSLYEDGKLVLFQTASAEPSRVHPMQIWQTPFTSDTYEVKREKSGSYLERIGNADLVRGISDVLTICRMIEEQNPRRETYEDLIAATGRLVDNYYWLSHADAGDIGSAVKETRATGELIIDEFEKVEALRAQAARVITDSEQSIEQLFKSFHPESWSTIEPFVDALTELRTKRGHLITQRDVRYVDRSRLDQLEKRVADRFDDMSQRTVTFLRDERALAPYAASIAALEPEIEKVQKTTDAETLRKRADEMVGALNLLTEMIGGIAIEDATIRISILERVSALMSNVNRVRAMILAKRKEILSKELVAEFGVQFNLLSQSVTSALAAADTPERCDTELSKLMLQLEDLEGRFSEFPEFLSQLATKREEIYEAFNARRQSLLDQRQRRAEQLVEAAGRMLQGIVRRAETYNDDDALNAYFASDAMVARLRGTADKLRELGDSVRADEMEGKLKTARSDASRGLRDRKDIFESDGNVIRFGEHRFSVNTQKLELTLVPREGRMDLHLTGTGFFERIDDPEFEKTRPFWPQEIVSETAEVYRAEYLAACIFEDAELRRETLTFDALQKAALSHDELLRIVRDYAASRYDEGYERGVHDEDAARILAKLVAMSATSGLLRYPSAPRAYAALFWADFDDRAQRETWERQAQSLARLRSSFAHNAAIGKLTTELEDAIHSHLSGVGIELTVDDLHLAGAYLFEELAETPLRFVLSAEAAGLLQAFGANLRTSGADRQLLDDLRALEGNLARRFSLMRAWLEGFVGARDSGLGAQADSFRRAIDEAAVAALTDGKVSRERSSALAAVDVTGLLGQHTRIANGTMSLRLDEFLSRLSRFRHERAPAYREYQKIRHALIEKQRHRLRLSEFEPRVLSSFVRNRLINDVYLPLIGSNLAKQMGTVGEKKRTDLMGMLLLISPPGYGKTTLMEYLASRLGLVFMKINGPALGHAVTSLDPDEAPNATARQEIEKLNLALEMGNNVMLYVDDIQHTNPEFLQKFISLCDAQRKIEGVWHGVTKTYDLRGKRFCVCMAGNPYTESGEKFKIPDMLANRSDVYNLGDVLSGKDDLFALSYIENALTSNVVTAPLLSRDPADVDRLVRIANGEAIPADQLSYDYSAVELNEILGVLRKLVKAQRLLSIVNRQYILSAAQQDAYRSEPPFKLQGSYRNMNKLAEKIVPAMNDEELERLIDDHYMGEAQTLTTGAEENLLKLAELRGRLTAEQKTRWEHIKQSYTRMKRVGDESDPASRVMAELSVVSDRLGEIAKTIMSVSGVSTPVSTDLTPYLEQLNATLGALRQVHATPPRIEVAAPEKSAPPPDYELISKEAYLINGTLIPLMKFMAFRFRGYRGVRDPKIKQLIARLERVSDLPELVSALEGISTSVLASLTDDQSREV